MLKKYQIPASTILPAHGYAVFYEFKFNSVQATVPFSLNSAKGDDVLLSKSLAGVPTGYRASARFGPSANGVSFGRYQTSVGFDFVAMSNLTFGTSVKAGDATNLISVFRTGAGATNSYPLISPVVLTEIMYHPPDFVVPGVSTNDNTRDEFIELFNRTGVPVALYDTTYPSNAWRLRDAVDFDFPLNTVIPAGGYLLVVSFDPATNGASKAAFQSVYGTNSALVGPWSGKLDNGSDKVELYRPDAPQGAPSPDLGLVPYILVDRVVYQDRAPWPVNADGLGLSLQRVNPHLHGNDPVNWIAAVPTPGPGNVMGDPDTDHDGMPDAWEDANGFNRNNPNDAALDADGDGMTNLQEYIAGTDPHNAGSKLKIDSIVINGGARDIRFQAIGGKSYTLLYRDSLVTGAWAKLKNGSLPPGPSLPLTLTDNSPATGGRYYRIVTPAQP